MENTTAAHSHSQRKTYRNIMEGTSRTNRRRDRNHRLDNSRNYAGRDLYAGLDFYISQIMKSRDSLTKLASFLLACSLVAIVYLILQYHCNIHQAKSHLGDITKNIDDLSENLLQTKQNHRELEKKVSDVLREVPKIKGQFEVLESIACSVDRKNHDQRKSKSDRMIN